MESYVGLYFLILIAVLLIQYAAANVFYSIACMKGHHERRYFWWCFFLSLAGYLMVAALPDRHRENEQDRREWLKRPDVPAESGRMDGAGQDAQANDDKRVKPAAADGQIQCPVCGLIQKSDRKVCWECGVKFEHPQE